MTFEIVMTKQADTDLRNIFAYIAFELLSPETALGQLDRLEKGIFNLVNFPEKFRKYDKEPWHSRGLRVMPIDNYLVYYVSDKEAGLITIIRVLYAGRDVDKELTKNADMY